LPTTSSRPRAPFLSASPLVGLTFGRVSSTSKAVNAIRQPRQTPDALQAAPVASHSMPTIATASPSARRWNNRSPLTCRPGRYYYNFGDTRFVTHGLLVPFGLSTMTSMSVTHGVNYRLNFGCTPLVPATDRLLIGLAECGLSRRLLAHGVAAVQRPARTSRLDSARGKNLRQFQTIRANPLRFPDLLTRYRDTCAESSSKDSATGKVDKCVTISKIGITKP